MREGSLRQGPVVGFAAAVLAVLITQVALAGGESGTGRPEASASASVNKQLKKLKKRVARLQTQVNQLQGQLGPQGPQGERDAQGPPGVSGLQQISKSSAVDNNAKTATASCPAGKRAIGGGGTHSAVSSGGVVLDQIQPSDANTVPGVVTVSAYQLAGTAPGWSVTAFAICATVL